NTPNSATNFVPPLIGNPSEPSLIGSLIGLGIILMTPNVVNMLKQMLKAPKMDSGVGKSIAGATGVVTGAGKSTTGAAGLAVFGDPYTGKKGFEAIRSSFLRKA
ncbi:MAG: hypothetical protein U1E54_04670, partial [Candidatus Levybacteria bacterium]|nr:hypothetical protein [Candidatus Levybacteria bacterium]